MSIQPFHTSNGSGLWFISQQIILSLALSLALWDILAKAGIFFMNKFFFSEVLFSFVQTGTTQRGWSLGFFCNLLCTKHRHLLDAYLCPGKDVHFLPAQFFVTFKEKQSESTVHCSFSFLDLLPRKVISRLSRGVMVIFFPPVTEVQH